MTLAIEPVELDHDDDSQGCLVLHNGRLAAVLAQLSESHADRSGHWFLECGFGSLSRCDMEFDTLDAARTWISKQLNAQSD